MCFLLLFTIREKFRSPRVLTCLHVFCEECIDGLLEENEDVNNSIECPECNQATTVSNLFPSNEFEPIYS